MSLFTQPRSFSPAHCRGFSMVELMIALVISLILMGGIGQIFLSSKKSYTIQDTLGNQQENGRFVIETLSADIRRAGYMGPLEGVANIGGTEGEAPDDGTCPTNNNEWGRMLDTRIFGLNDTNVSNISTTVYACIPDANFLRGDVLVMRYQAPWVVGGLTTPDFENNDRLYLRTSLNQAVLFKGKDEADLANGLPVLNGRTGELVARAYYVGDSTSGDCNGVAVPALFRVALNDDGEPEAEELAYGVEHFQVRYGIDADLNGSVDRYFDAGEDFNGDAVVNLDDWDDVIAARIWVLTRSECPETGLDTSNASENTYIMGDETYTPVDTTNRGYRRQLYTTTVSIRNRLRQ